MPRSLWGVSLAALCALSPGTAQSQEIAAKPAESKKGAPEVTLKSKADNVQQRKVSPVELLEFVCAKNEAWHMDQLALFEQIQDLRTRRTFSASVPESEQAELSSRMQSEDPWPLKLLAGVEHTPLYLRIVCRYEDQPQIKDVIDKFGEPDQKQKDTIGGRQTPQQGEWCYYGPVRLGVYQEGRILSVQVDSPNWRTLCEKASQAPQHPKADVADANEAVEAAKWRTWTTADGRFKQDAKFVRFAAGKVTLERKDGTTVDVRLDILCSDDQEFVRERKWTRAAANKQSSNGKKLIEDAPKK